MPNRATYLRRLRPPRRFTAVVYLLGSLFFVSNAHSGAELIFLSGWEDCSVAFPDTDGDAWGNELRGTDNCSRPASYVANPGDCNDSEPSVHPGASDVPDGSFADTNCDAIDGDIARAAFVASDGVDGASCSIAAPCATIQHALERVASDPARDHVYVQAGQYSGLIELVAGAAVFGGYGATWSRANYDIPGHASVIRGGVRASGILASGENATILENLVVSAADGDGAGASSIAVRISASSGIVFERLQVTAGSGAAGVSRLAPPSRPTEGEGGNGQPGCENSGGLCASCNRPPGGLAGTSSCDRPGGVGGLPGIGGGGGSVGGTGVVGTPGGAGAPCGGSRSCDGAIGVDGLHGVMGASGSPGAPIGEFAGFEYMVADGSPGAIGAPGNGGGGGGGGGGGDDNCDSYGSSGGGGGGGGCGGMPGSGGGGGGASVAILLVDSTVAIVDGIVAAGNGGLGGDGASGGAGGIGGAPGNGGAYGGAGEQDDAGDGAAGGRGGDGGQGGAGGGGGGGPSIGIVCAGTSTVQLTRTQVSAGTAGAGGAGGAPTGLNGNPGLAASTHGCPAS